MAPSTHFLPRDQTTHSEPAFCAADGMTPSEVPGGEDSILLIEHPIKVVLTPCPLVEHAYS
jgi:hypothetical protein